MKYILLLLLSTSLSAVVAGDGVLYIAPKASVSPGVDPSERITGECKFTSQINDDIAHQALGVYSEVVRSKPSGKHHTLEVDISEIFGLAGGAWSGTKNATIQGTLKDQSGTIVGSFTLTRHSMGGIKGAFGTCKVFRKISRVMAQDVQTFLANPKKGVVIKN